MENNISSSSNQPFDLNHNIQNNNDWPLKTTQKVYTLILSEAEESKPISQRRVDALKDESNTAPNEKPRDETIGKKSDLVLSASLGVQVLKQNALKSPLYDSNEHARPKFPVLDLSQNISEPDSLIDLYKYRKNIQQTPISPDFPLTPVTPDLIMAARSPIEMDKQEAKWIHRDKLTQIEIQEYIDRGMRPPAELLHRAAQRERAARAGNVRRPEIITNDHKRQRFQSPESPPISPISDDDEPFVPEDPRSPEEIANDPYEESSGHMTGRLRASSSKIPLATSSPLPVPAEHIERDTPLRRKRETSNEWDDEYTPKLKMRSRGGSIGSQVLLDDEGYNGALSPQMSPSKVKNQPKSKTPSTNKVVNGKQRTTSGGSRVVSVQRPGTRNGTNERPRTAVNRPEGDPPWMDQMYKPDPMLPPDQQMLPTHAKRMMAEQWEKEGRPQEPFQRGLSPVRIYDDDLQKEPYDEPEQYEHVQEQKPQFHPSNNSQWPLKPTNAVEAPKSPLTDHGGYSTMPKVQKTPSIGQPTSPRRPEQQLQVEQGKNEKEEKEKGGCGCCVVM